MPGVRGRKGEEALRGDPGKVMIGINKWQNSDLFLEYEYTFYHVVTNLYVL